MLKKFQTFLEKQDLARKTVESYVWTVKRYLSLYEEFNKNNLLAYKGVLMEHYKPQTVNLRLQGINKYLEFTKQEKIKMINML